VLVEIGLTVSLFLRLFVWLLIGRVM
jgi:hypothetical protein